MATTNPAILQLLANMKNNRWINDITRLNEENMNVINDAFINIIENGLGSLSSQIESNSSDINNIDIKKADLNSPTFTGSPKAPKPTMGDNSTRIATTSFVNEALTNMFTQLEIVKIVTDVSEVTQPNILYLIPGSITGTDDIYDEYVFVNNQPEKVGSVGAETIIDEYNEDYILDNYDNYVNPTLEDGSVNTSYVGDKIPSVKFVQQAIDAALSEVNTILAGLVDSTT